MEPYRRQRSRESNIGNFSQGSLGATNNRLQRPKFRSASNPSFGSSSNTYFSPSTTPVPEDVKAISTDELPDYPKLDYRPFQLRTWFLVLTFVGYLACFLAIGYLLKLSLNEEEEPFKPKTLYNYFVARYAPTIIGTITTIVWRSKLSTLQRMTPYISMAADRRGGDTGTHAWRSIHTQYFPFLHVSQLFKNRHTLLIAGYFTNWVVIFLTPFKSTYITGDLRLSEFLASAAQNGTGSKLAIHVSQAVSYVLLVIYGILMLMTVIIAVRLWGRKTGLKWDPVSLADQMQLCHESKMLRMFKDSEMEGLKQFGQRLSDVYLRLGYWRKPNGEIRHGIDIVGPGHNPSQMAFDKPYSGQTTPAIPGPIPTAPPEPLSREYRKLARLRYAEVPLFLKTGFVCFCILFNSGILFFLFYFIVKGKFEKGFTLNSTSSFQLYLLSRFLPTLLAAFTAVYWISTDSILRILQPFAGMYQEGGKEARQTLLLDYPHCLPVEITVKALANQHYKLALVSFISLFSVILPVIAGGTFTATTIRDPNDAITGYPTKATNRNIYAITGYFILAAICLLLLLPNRNRKLPRTILTFADVISFCYASPLLAEPDLLDMTDHQRDEQCHLYAKVLLKKDKYAFGIYQSTAIGDFIYRLGFGTASTIQHIKYKDRKNPIDKQYIEEEGDEGPSSGSHSLPGMISAAAAGFFRDIPYQQMPMPMYGAPEPERDPMPPPGTETGYSPLQPRMTPYEHGNYGRY